MCKYCQVFNKIIILFKLLLLFFLYIYNSVVGFLKKTNCIDDCKKKFFSFSSLEHFSAKQLERSYLKLSKYKKKRKKESKVNH